MADGRQAMFDQAFAAAVLRERDRGIAGEELILALNSYWMHGDWPEPALGERINLLDELLGEGAFGRALLDLFREEGLEVPEVLSEWLDARGAE
jgi:hypothetical protein